MYITVTTICFCLGVAIASDTVSADQNKITSLDHEQSVLQASSWMSPNPANPPSFMVRQTKRQPESNTCGMQQGKSVQCDPNSIGGGPCCSQYNYCGNGPLYCGDGCQSAFGQCGDQPTQKRVSNCGPKHKNQKCVAGECCSANGKCGRSEAFCGKYCQHDFGFCQDQEVPKKDSEPEQDHKPINSPERCGKNFNNATCVNNDCCSSEGWCGKGNDFCSVPQSCQRGFGFCDSDAVPMGQDLSPETQPRRQKSDVPYGQEIKKCTNPKTAALTFDDGPSNNTEKILDLLRDHKAKATFFIAGNINAKGMIDRTDVWIKVIKRIITEGHQIASHTWSHPHLNEMSRHGRIFEMLRNDRALSNIIGMFPTYMRAPYVQCSNESHCLDNMRELGYHVVSWDVDSLDWKPEVSLDQMKSTIDQVIKHRGKDDNIFLIQHDRSKHVIELAKHVLEQVKRKGWKAVTLGECLHDSADKWYVDPFWVRPRAIAGRQEGLETGCVVATKGFCGQFYPVTNKSQCAKAVSSCKSTHKKCKKQLGHNHQACAKYKKFCDIENSYCKECGKDHKPCESDQWSFNWVTGQRHFV